MSINIFDGHVKRLTYFNTRLKTINLKSITSPPNIGTLAFLEYTTVANTSTFTLRAASGSLNYELIGVMEQSNHTQVQHQHICSADTHTLLK